MVLILTPTHLAGPRSLSICDFAVAKQVIEKCVHWIAAGNIKAERVRPWLIRMPASEPNRIGATVGAH